MSPFLNGELVVGVRGPRPLIEVGAAVGLCLLPDRHASLGGRPKDMPRRRGPKRPLPGLQLLKFSEPLLNRCPVNCLRFGSIFPGGLPERSDPRNTRGITQPSSHQMQQAFAQSHRRARHLKIGIAASGVVLILVLWTVVATSVLFARQAALHRAQSDGANLTAAFANEVRHLLDSVSAAMEIITTKMHVEGETLDLQAWVKMIPLMTTPGTQSVFIGPDGKLVSASLDAHSKPIDLSDREHFRVHLDGSFKGLYIGRPVVGRISLKPAIPVSKRVETNDGRFLGVLLFMLTPSDFTTLYSSVDLGKRGIIALEGLDGVTRVRFSQSTPDGVAGPGVSVAGGPRPRMMSEGAQGGFVRESVIDHVTRFYSYRRVPQYPLGRYGRG